MAVNVTIWHNPRCSKSRQTLALLESRGLSPKIRPYLNDPPKSSDIRAALEALQIDAIALVRTGEKAFKEAGLTKESSDADLIAAMVKNPIVIERPVVFTDKGAAIGRPPEAVLEVL